jgi:drug/metabolite transporter (DMT)-like permease
MLPLIFAVATAAVWGTADFCGGKATQRAPALAVSVLSKVAGLPVLVLGLAIAGGRPTLSGLGWGGLAGLFGMAGVILLYRGLATGAMTVVAPVTAVTSALVPFAAGIMLDGVPRALAVVGAACAVGAIALVSAGSAGETTHKPVGLSIVGLALAAGTGFGLFMAFLSRAKDQGGVDTGLWPLVSAQLTALGLGALLILRPRLSRPGRLDLRPAQQHAPSIRLTGPTLRWAVVAGTLDFSANVLYLFATRAGELSIVAPISSLYPASTVLLALAVDRERVRPMQLAGLGLAATALVLVAS